MSIRSPLLSAEGRIARGRSSVRHCPAEAGSPAPWTCYRSTNAKKSKHPPVAIWSLSPNDAVSLGEVHGALKAGDILFGWPLLLRWWFSGVCVVDSSGGMSTSIKVNV